MNIVIATLHVRRSAQAVPLAAACLAASLPEERQRTTCLLDFFPEQSPEEMATQILALDPDLVACPTYSWNRVQMITLTRSLHQAKPDLHLVVGGPEASGDHLKLARQAPWLIISRGEGEANFPSLVETLSRQAPLDALSDLTWVEGEELRTTAAQPSRQQWSSLPSPWLGGTLDPAAREGVLWEISRGCTFSCDYCFDARGQKGVHELDWTRLEAELDLFVEAGVSQIWVLDSTFNFPPARGRALIKLLLAKAPNIHFHIEAKAEFLDRDTAHMLGELSCSIQFGLQSSNPEALKAVHRSFDLEHFTQQIQLLNREGAVYGFDLIYGLPKDNYQNFRTSLDMAIQLAPNHVHMFPLAILPGTRLAEQKERHGLQAQSEPPYEIICSASWSREDLAKSQRLAASTDFFYNSGRAVAFFPALLQLLEETPSEFFEHFSTWARTTKQVDLCQPSITETSASLVYELQAEYLSWRLSENDQRHLVAALQDLLSFHFHYAEALLDTPVQPLETVLPAGEDLWQTCWQTAPQIRLVPFTYEIVDLMDMEDFDLEEFTELFRPVGSVGMFIRRNDEVFCESLSEDFHHLMSNSNGKQTPQQIFEGSLPRPAAEELVSFAVAEGLLQRSSQS